MHLLTFIKLYHPNFFFRLCVLATQGIFFNGFFLAYLLNPQFCHRFVGYLEEEAVHTYTDIINAIDDGRLKEWRIMAAPEIAIVYWKLEKNATMKDMLLAVRADESNHRDVNHVLADTPTNKKNPFLSNKNESPL